VGFSCLTFGDRHLFKAVKLEAMDFTLRVLLSRAVALLLKFGEHHYLSSTDITSRYSAGFSRLMFGDRHLFKAPLLTFGNCHYLEAALTLNPDIPCA
jgi:hypothetical protein